MAHGTGRLPHPIPYQGSKRHLAGRILALVVGRKFGTLYEPFAGSGAITIAAARAGLATRYVMSDSFAPLVGIWRSSISAPHDLADAYEILWTAQQASDDHYYQVRDEFNETQDPGRLLYLLARCVKNAPRFNQRGRFNQSPDNRRRGVHPQKMRRALVGVSALLGGRTEVVCGDFERVVAQATAHDLVYLDPPYMGTTTGVNKRYHQGLDRERLIAVLADLNARSVPYLLSYDGRSGNKTYGETLPASLDMVRLELDAGRSSQATLNGRTDRTIESLYVSGLLRRTTDHRPLTTGDGQPATVYLPTRD